MGSFARGDLGDFIIPKAARLVEESHERPTIGARRNRGVQDVIEGEGGMAIQTAQRGPVHPSEVRRLYRADVPIAFVFAEVSWPLPWFCHVFVVRAVGGVSGSSLSDSNADANKADMLIASSACRPM